MLTILVPTLAHPELRIHTITMLNQGVFLDQEAAVADLFDSGTIKIISDIIVYEDEDVREDGLQVLSNLVESSAESMEPVTAALRESVSVGFSNGPQQRLRTIAFVRTAWNGTNVHINC
jgi:hypothetical protein